MTRPRLVSMLEVALSELRSKQLITDSMRRLFRLCDAALIANLEDLNARVERIESGRQ